MQTITASSYKLNNTLTEPSANFTQSISFTSNNKFYTEIKYVAAEQAFYYGEDLIYSNGVYVNDIYKYVSLETNQEVEDDFNTWFSQNSDRLVVIKESQLKAIANALRLQFDSTDLITADEMAEKINELTSYDKLLIQEYPKLDI